MTQTTLTPEQREELEDFSDYVVNFKPVDVIQLNDMLKSYRNDVVKNNDTDRELVSTMKFNMLISGYSDMILQYLEVASDVYIFLKEKDEKQNVLQ